MGKNAKRRREAKQSASDQAKIEQFDDDLRECLDQLRQHVPHETDPVARENGYAMIRRLERELGVEN